MNRWHAKVRLPRRSPPTETWQSPLSRPLRLLAEYGFGTFFLAAIVAGLRGIPKGLLVVVPAYLGALLVQSRGDTPVSWWSFVILNTAIGALALVAAFVAPT
jgi:hypothetical protein